MEKKKDKNELKPCMICTLFIDFEKDKYLVLNEFNGKELLAESYYHADCFRQKFLVQQQIKDMATQMRNMMGRVLG